MRLTLAIKTSQALDINSFQTQIDILENTSKSMLSFAKDTLSKLPEILHMIWLSVP